jgi:hypothetical protein
MVCCERGPDFRHVSSGLHSRSTADRLKRHSESPPSSNLGSVLYPTTEPGNCLACARRNCSRNASFFEKLVKHSFTALFCFWQAQTTLINRPCEHSASACPIARRTATESESGQAQPSDQRRKVSRSLLSLVVTDIDPT